MFLVRKFCLFSRRSCWAWLQRAVVEHWSSRTAKGKSSFKTHRRMIRLSACIAEAPARHDLKFKNTQTAYLRELFSTSVVVLTSYRRRNNGGLIAAVVSPGLTP